jgi:hypothetical protein
VTRIHPLKNLWRKLGKVWARLGLVLLGGLPGDKSASINRQTQQDLLLKAIMAMLEK